MNLTKLFGRQEFTAFAELFRYRATKAGFSLDDPRTRPFLAHRLLQRLPSFNLSPVLSLHNHAPPLVDLLFAARQEAASSRIRRGTGRLFRPSLTVHQLHSPTSAAQLVAPSLADAEFTAVSSPPASSQRSFRGDRRLKRSITSEEDSTPKRRSVAPPSAGVPRRSLWCYRCNADDHIVPDCKDVDFVDRGAFRPVYGQRPTGGRRAGESAGPRIGS